MTHGASQPRAQACPYGWANDMQVSCPPWTGTHELSPPRADMPVLPPALGLGAREESCPSYPPLNGEVEARLE